ncbi:MAG: GGDEF domain-containing protein [Oscillospiraceae bacterium]|nr:GGDEF domain-containing protein [Oscillospiraceae bacterium]
MELQSIIVANSVGFFLCFVMLVSSSLLRMRRLPSDKVFTAMIAITAVSCLDELIAYTIEGVPFSGAQMVGTLVNAFLYASNVTVSYLWCAYVYLRLQRDEDVDDVWLMRLAIPAVVGVCGAFVELFTPILFRIDETLHYHRNTFGRVYFALMFGYLAYSVLIRHRHYLRRGKVDFFPIWMFLIPVAIGVTAQFLVYGLSFGWCSVAIGLVGVYMSLQNELAYVDPLTKLYNRNYLDHILVDLARRRIPVGGMMVDMDYFKQINDSFGHTVGDQALTEAAHILRTASPEDALVIRFAGDEFIVLHRTADEKEMAKIGADVEQALAAFNETSGRPYQLSFSLGTSLRPADEADPDRFLREMDERMYAVKAKRHAAR